MRTFAGSALDGILVEVRAERARQDERWGEQNQRSVYAGENAKDYLCVSSGEARRTYENRVADGTVAWADIALEEFAESLDAKDDEERRAELVQCAAVFIAWIECLDRRAKR